MRNDTVIGSESIDRAKIDGLFNYSARGFSQIGGESLGDLQIDRSQLRLDALLEIYGQQNSDSYFLLRPTPVPVLVANVNGGEHSQIMIEWHASVKMLNDECAFVYAELFADTQILTQGCDFQCVDQIYKHDDPLAVPFDQAVSGLYIPNGDEVMVCGRAYVSVADSVTFSIQMYCNSNAKMAVRFIFCNIRRMVK